MGDPSDSDEIVNSVPETHVLAIASHVVYGYVGNTMATFCMQTLGCNVAAINTVNFSNHTGYGQFTGPRTDASTIQTLYKVLSLLFSLLTFGKPHPHSHPSLSEGAHHGTSILLSHPTAIARLVRLLYDEVTLLSANLPTHSFHVRIVNTTTTLLHHILLSPAATDTKGNFELQRALSGTLVGVHRFRVVMTRIAFREERAGGEEGISEESAIKATEVLEEYVTPDEAVQLVEVLGRGEGDDIDIDVDEMYGGEQGGDPMDQDGDEEAQKAEFDVMAGVER